MLPSCSWDVNITGSILQCLYNLDFIYRVHNISHLDLDIQAHTNVSCFSSPATSSESTRNSKHGCEPRPADAAFLDTFGLGGRMVQLQVIPWCYGPPHRSCDLFKTKWDWNVQFVHLVLVESGAMGDAIAHFTASAKAGDGHVSRA